MAQDFERVFKSQVTSSAHTLLTSNSDDALIGIRLTNITTSALTVSVWIDAAGAGSTASIVYLAKDLGLKIIPIINKITDYKSSYFLYSQHHCTSRKSY